MAEYNDSFKSSIYMHWDICMEQKETYVVLAGDTVHEEDITDVRAYNHANGIMWIVFSLSLWVGTIVGLNDMKTGGNIILFDSTIGLLLLILTYINIHKKYKKL